MGTIELFFLLGTTPVILLAAVIGGVMVAMRRGDEPPDEPGIGTVRRIFLYGIALLALIFAAWGISALIGGLLDAIAGTQIVARRDTRFALGLAFVLVGAPAWITAWLAAERSVRRHPVELRSLLRRTYLTLARGITLTVVVVNAIRVGEQLVRETSFEGGPWGLLLGWGAAWVLHERLASLEAPPTRRTQSIDRLYRFYGAVVGLALLAVGAGRMLYEALDSVYDAVVLTDIIARSDPWDALRMPLVFAVVGGAAWWWHWLRAVRRDAGTTLWLVYIFLFGVLSGAAVALFALSMTLFGVLQWFIGVPDLDSASAHFEFLPGTLAALAVAAGVWGYHRTVQREHAGATEGRSEPERIYRYLLAAAGLLMLAGGMATLFAVAIDVLAPDPADLVRSAAWWRNPLVAAVTLLVVGAPLWARYWFEAQGRLDSPGERDALSRRIFLFGVLGVAALTALVNLVIVLYTWFDAWFEGELSAVVLHDTRWSIALLLTAGAVSVYYWLVLREDQAAQPAPEPEAVRLRDVLLLAPGDVDDGLANDLRRQLRVTVRAMRRLDTAAATPTLSPEQSAALMERIGAAGAERVAVILEPDGSAQVLPYSTG